jgi:DeoR family transcriptional regulator, aga operon transcriptional repressor
VPKGVESASRDRTVHILDCLTRTGYVEIDVLATELAVSTATIRRDLDGLAQKQLLIRTRGGAATNSSTYDLPLKYNALIHAEEKQRIAREAASRVRPSSVVGLNAGTTTTEVARAIALRADLQGKPGDTTLTIVTNAINIAHELTVRSQFSLVVVGGTVRQQSYELIGPLAELMLAEISMDEVILTANGLDLMTGANCHNIGEAAMGRAMMRRARRVTLVVDSSKIGVSTFATLCGIEKLDTVITDTGAEDKTEVIDGLLGAGVDVVMV